MKMNIFNAIGPNLLGYLVITEDGAVLASSGELENDEKTSGVLYKLINLAPSLDPSLFSKNSVQRITIAYEEFSYVVCLSNRKFYIAKKKL
ncbi:unnamed protein product [Chironomus riparius]|uniref:Late endosomal/lysosomal adaptor and MAPK and MTOR activator 4 n=1 Tax=Chironomus riparius TaxID=315576 RepID=A0A9N9S3T9_9DIPT|nr:unnamed protein product [Chironomus riparius]